jgi:transglutaminase-like putative cysteine protease
VSSSPAGCGPATSRADLVDAGFVVALCLLALLGFRTVFGGDTWLLVGLLGIGCGLVIGYVCALTRQRAIVVLLGAVGTAALVSGVVFPDAATVGVLPTPDSAHQVLRGGLRGWQDMLTVIPPIGRTGDLVAVPFVGAFAAALCSYSLARRTRTPGLGVLPPALLLVAAILVGTVEPAGRSGIHGWPGGPGWQGWQGFATAVLGLLWGAVQQRRTVSGATGRLSRRPLGVLLTLALTAALIAAGLPQLNSFAQARRVVLRDRIEPPFDARAYPSPLTGFRRYTNARKEALFTVTGLPAGARIRLAAMDQYDGLVWSVAGAGDGQDGGRTASGWFERAGEQLAVPATGTHVQVSFDFRAGTGTGAAASTGLGGVWLPGVSQLTTARVRRPGSSKDVALYVNRASATVGVPGGIEGVTAVEQVVVPALTTVAQLPKGASLQRLALPTPRNVPEKVAGFARAAAGTVPDDSAAPVAEILAVQKALRNGYYSDGRPGQSWSESGHSDQRLRTMLDNDKLNGNDEQYAALMALLLRSLDIPARVVVGFDQPATAAADRAAGRAVTITGADAVAWVEVPFAGYGWIAVDPTPDENRQLTETKPVPQPRSDVANNPIPPQTPRIQEAPAHISGRGTKDAPDTRHPRWLRLALWAGLGLGLLALLTSPAWVLVAIKRRRRRRRRRTGPAASQIAAGWQELLDLRTDLGRRPPGYATRQEQAAGMELPEAFGLAVQADAATFAGAPVGADASIRYWRRVSAVRWATLQGLPRRRRWWVMANPSSLRTKSLRTR